MNSSEPRRRPLSIFATLFLFFLAAEAFSQSPCDTSAKYYGAPAIFFHTWAKPKRSYQQQSNWCWAASAEMVFRYHGLRVRQKKLVRHIFKRADDKPASMRQIVQAFDGYLIRKRGKCYEVLAGLLDNNPQSITGALKDQWVLIAGLFDSSDSIGHAYVLYGVDSFCKNGKAHIKNLYLHDPLPGSGGSKKLSWNMFVSKQPEILLLQKKKCEFQNK